MSNDYSNMNTYRHDNINITTGAKHPIKEWTVGVEVEEGARKQLFNCASLPFIFKHIAVMPDCLHVDTEVLTKNGFIKIANLNGNELIANFNPNTKLISFSRPKNVIRRTLRNNEKVYEYYITTLNKSMVVTENHRMPVIGYEGMKAKNTNNLCIKDLHWCGDGIKEKTNRDLNFDEVLLLLWFLGDGNIKITKNKKSINKRIRFGIKKERKLKRIKELLNRLNYDYTVSASDKQTEIYINTESSKKLLKNFPEKQINWNLLTTFSKEEAICIINECISIDGDFVNWQKYGGQRLNSKSKDFMDFMGALAAIYLGVSNLNQRVTAGYNETEIYYMSVVPYKNLKDSRSGMHNKKIIKKEIKYEDDVVCLECEDSFFIARQNGLTFISGNCHAGIGATVGSVIPTYKAIIPAAVGVDLGCGVICQKTTIKASQLPDNLSEVRSVIEKAVPHGRTDNGGRNDRGAWKDTNAVIETAWMGLEPGYKKLIEKHPKLEGRGNPPQCHLGTLGTGNHFIEVCIDFEDEGVWIMLHSGSRGVGNKIGSHFISLAKQEMEKFFINDSLPDINLSYLPEGSQYFNDYVDAVGWAQNYARENREVMMSNILKALKKCRGIPKFETTEVAVNCHHNYVEKEFHFGKNVWVTRKGAVRARKGDLSIIPGSMGAKSFIVRGLGNKDSFCSASHGAGRKMSRTEAKNTFSVEDHKKATEGVECKKDSSVIDETPGAYKAIDDVMNAQKDLVEAIHTLKQVVCVKG